MFLNAVKIFIFSFLVGIIVTSAQADLLLHPTRLVFSDIKGAQTALIDIANTGLQTEIYRLRLVNKRMDEHGQLINADQAIGNELFATQLIQFSPRQLTLAPYASQTVRVGIRKPENLAAGEYRSHLLFERVADNTNQSDIAVLVQPTPQQTQKNVQISVQALVSASIPVFIYHGAVDAQAKINDLVISANENAEKKLSFKLVRHGNRSLHGTLVLKFISDTGKITELVRKSDIAVYYPTLYRLLDFDLTEQNLGSGKLQITYFSDSGVLAQHELSVVE